MIKELGTKNTALREKLQKYLYYHQVKPTNLNIFQLRKCRFVVKVV